MKFQLLPFDDVLDCDEAVFAMVVADEVDSPLHIGRFTLREVWHWRVAIKEGWERGIGRVVRKEGVARFKGAARDSSYLPRFYGTMCCSEDPCSDAMVDGLAITPPGPDGFMYNAWREDRGMGVPKVALDKVIDGRRWASVCDDRGPRVADIAIVHE